MMMSVLVVEVMLIMIVIVMVKTTPIMPPRNLLVLKADND